MGFEPFFSNRSASVEATASHTWRPALPPVDRPIAPLATAASGEPPASMPRRVNAPVSINEAFRDGRPSRV